MTLDANAISRLYETHAGVMLGFFMRRTFQPEASMDLVAETFACAFADRRRFHGSSESEQLAWLYAIARHRLIDFARRGKVERAALAKLGFHRRELTDTEYERVEELAGLEHVRERIALGLEGLDHEQRQALELRIVQERPYMEVAEALGVSEQTARARVSRAVDRLRKSPAMTDLLESESHA
jgi:RNA polymerase sigma factor (sigma-70 family)